VHGKFAAEGDGEGFGVEVIIWTVFVYDATLGSGCVEMAERRAWQMCVDTPRHEPKGWTLSQNLSVLMVSEFNLACSTAYHEWNEDHW
jgi:hypothetical protein